MLDDVTTFTLTIEMNNEAFNSDEENERELTRLLRLVADNIERGYAQGSVFDFNGNTVGHYEIEG